MPADGGVPQRLTFTATLGRDDVSDRMGPNNIVMGWKNNDEILFRSRMHDPNDFIGQLFTVSVKGGLPQQIPLPRGGFCSFSPDGKKLAYNRIFREFRTWKRYRGGMADDVWIYDFATKKTENITNDPACDVFPMWAGDKIYFLSDRDDKKRFNLYVYDLADKATTQLTKFTDFDIKFPSLGDKAIVFENARLHLSLRPGHGEGDQGPDPDPRRLRRRPHRAQGRQQEHRRLRNLPRRQAGPVRCPRRSLHRPGQGRRHAQPDRHLRRPRTQSEVVARRQMDRRHLRRDRRGRDSHLVPPGRQRRQPTQLTTMPAAPYKYHLVWSPDSKKILWADKKMRLHVRRRRHARRSSWSPQAKTLGDPAITSGRRTANGSPTPGPTRTMHAEGLALFAGAGQSFRGHRRLVRFDAAGVLRRRQVSLLRLRTRFQARSTATPNGTTPTPTWPASTS